MTEEVLWLLIIFQVKHFLSDFPLQGKYMLGKFKTGWDWVGPLSAHCLVHAFFTYIISLCFLFKTPGGFVYAFALALFDFTIHFIQDRIKASPNILGRWKPDSPFFWWALGQDQMTHHLTHYAIIWAIVSL